METNAQRKWREHRDACQVCGENFGKWCPTGKVLRSAAMDSPKSPTEERKEAAEAFTENVATIDPPSIVDQSLCFTELTMLDKALAACQAAKLQTATIEAANRSGKCSVRRSRQGLT